MLEIVVKPWIDQSYAGKPCIWQQDSVLSCKTKTTQQWCSANFHLFWSAEIWPPNARYLNLLDYGIWVTIERKACLTSHAGVAALMAFVEREWVAMHEDFVKRMCATFRLRLEAKVSENGDQFEK